MKNKLSLLLLIVFFVGKPAFSQDYISGELLASKSESEAIAYLKTLIKKYKGTSHEPEMRYQLAELYLKKSKTSNMLQFADIKEELKPEKGMDVKYAKMANEQYKNILYNFKDYDRIEEVVFNQGFLKFKETKLDEAITILSEFEEKYPKSKRMPEALLMLGEAHFQNKKFDKSSVAFTKVEKYNSYRLNAYARYKNAWALYNIDRKKESIAKMISSFKKSSFDFENKAKNAMDVREQCLDDLAFFYSENYKAKQAYSFFSKISPNYDFYPAMLKLSGIFQSHSKYEESSTVLKQVYKKSSNLEYQLDALGHLAENEFSETKRKEAVGFLSLYTQKCPTEDEKCSTVLKEKAFKFSNKWYNEGKESKKFDHVSDAFGLLFAREKDETQYLNSRFIWAEVLFNEKNYVKSHEQYFVVFKAEKKPERRHEALYSSIISLDTVEEGKNKNYELIITLVNTYQEAFAKGEHVETLVLRKGQIQFLKKRYPEVVVTLGPLSEKASNNDLKVSAQDLVIESLTNEKKYEDLYSVTKKWIPTERDADRLALLTQMSMESCYSSAQTYLDAKNDVKAIEWYSKYIDEFSKKELFNLDSFWNLSQAYQNTKDIKGAILAIRKGFPYVGELKDQIQYKERENVLAKSIYDFEEMEKSLIELSKLDEGYKDQLFSILLLNKKYRDITSYFTDEEIYIKKYEVYKSIGTRIENDSLPGVLGSLISVNNSFVQPGYSVKPHSIDPDYFGMLVAINDLTNFRNYSDNSLESILESVVLFKEGQGFILDQFVNHDFIIGYFNSNLKVINDFDALYSKVISEDPELEAEIQPVYEMVMGSKDEILEFLVGYKNKIAYLNAEDLNKSLFDPKKETERDLSFVPIAFPELGVKQ